MKDIGATLWFLVVVGGGGLGVFQENTVRCEMVRCPLKQTAKWVSGSLNLMLELWLPH